MPLPSALHKLPPSPQSTPSSSAKRRCLPPVNSMFANGDCMENACLQFENLISNAETKLHATQNSQYQLLSAIKAIIMGHGEISAPRRWGTNKLICSTLTSRNTLLSWASSAHKKQESFWSPNSHLMVHIKEHSLFFFISMQNSGNKIYSVHYYST